MCRRAGVRVAAPAPTTSTSTTVPPSTTAEAATTTTVAPSTTATTLTTSDWKPPCAPFSGGPAPAGGPYNEAALDHFGPLGAQPTLTIDLPVGLAIPGNAPDQPPAVLPARIEGGVLLAVRPGSGSAAKTSILAAVNADGSKRWVRCIDGYIERVWVAPLATQPTNAVLGVVTAYGVNDQTRAWPIVSLIDGSDQGSLNDAASAAGIDLTDFAHHWFNDWAYPSSPTTFLLARLPVLGGREIEHLAR